LARSVRKNGVPTQEILRSLGTTDTIDQTYQKVEQAESSTIPRKTPIGGRVYQFGAVAALLDIAKRLDIVNIIDEFVTKRNQGLSVGSYIVLAAINRAVQPVSKNSFYEWFSRTVLPSSFPEATKKTLSSQSFWNHMTELDQDTITTIEDKISQIIVKNYDISTDCLLFDNTNFISYIASSNQALIPQRGHSKEKRSDLKIIGLSLMVSSDYNIPLFHEVYHGNRHDSIQLPIIIEKMKARVSSINNNYENHTFIFDKGNNSENIINYLDNQDHDKMFFVGGLRLNQCKELLEIEKNQLIPLEGDSFHGTTAYRFQKEIYKRKFTVLITDNPKLREAQLKGIDANILKCQAGLKELQNSLTLRAKDPTLKGRKRTDESVLKNVKQILSAEYMKKVFKYNINSDKNIISLTYEFDSEEYNNIIDKYLGKTILFTNRDNWSNESIVATYRSQFHVEDAFKQLKDIKYLTFRPIRHFTDKTIRVHAFYCVLALTLTNLLRLELDKLGAKMSVHKVIEELSKATQSIHVFQDGPKSKPEMESVICDIPPIVKEYIAKYGLTNYALK
jgi:transposase